jgi:DNA invertase Pin-like site-specific DNA recombinase
VVAWSVDRLGRSLQHLVEFLNEIQAKGVDLYLHQQGVDTGTPAGRALFQMCGVFGEFERSMIVERVKAGIKRARAKEQRWGRRTIEETDPEVCKQIQALRSLGFGMGKIGKAVGVSSRTVWRVLRSQPT